MKKKKSFTPLTQGQIEKINQAFDDCMALSPSSPPAIAQLIEGALEGLNEGYYRLCKKINGQWHTEQWLKKALLLSFKIKKNSLMGNADPMVWFDKIPLKMEGWQEQEFTKGQFRAVPGAIVRYSAYIEPNVILMPSFINIGARVGSNTLIDTWVTVGSCAQIGANCHISGGVGIGGVLEPVQATPVIIEDGCFIGARSEIAEGMVIEEGSVISMGVFLGASTKIVDRATGDIFYGRVPAYSVVVPGVMPAATPHMPQLACAVIVKKVDEKTRSKTSINDLLRD